MSDTTVYQKFVKRWEEVTELPTQTVGPFTPLYKRVTKRLKVMPLPLLVLLSVVVVAGLCVLLGSAVTFLVSLLQRGF
jgi:hypothetical protein